MRSPFMIVFVFSVAWLSGCGSGAPAGPDPVFPVSGKVTYQGKPLVGAFVFFSAQSKDRTASGRTDAEGVYKLSTFGANDGAVQGSQIVFLSDGESDAGSGGPDVPVESQDYVPPGYEKGKAKPTSGSAIPRKYSDPKTSGLTATVKADGQPNVINFDL